VLAFSVAYPVLGAPINRNDLAWKIIYEPGQKVISIVYQRGTGTKSISSWLQEKPPLECS